MKSRRRARRTVWAVLALLFVIGGGYAYLTRPAALRARFTGHLERYTEVESIGSISFSPWAGLTVRDLKLDLPGFSLASVPIGESTPPLLAIEKMRVRLGLWDLIRRRRFPHAIELDGVLVTLVRDDPATARVWEIENTPLLESIGFDPVSLPPLRVSDADVRVLYHEDGALKLEKRWIVSVFGRPERGGADRAGAGETTGYRLTVRQTGGSRIGDAQDLDGTIVDVRLHPDEMIADLCWVDSDLVAGLLPARARRLLAELDASGRFRVAKLQCAPGRLRELDLAFENTKLSVPVEARDAGIRPSARYVRLEHARGTLKVQRAASTSGSLADDDRAADVTLSLQAAMNGATTAFRVRADGVVLKPASRAQDAQHRGELALPVMTAERFDAVLEARALALPTLDTHPAFVTSSRLPGPIRNFFRKYKPGGAVNLRLELSKGGPGATDSQALHYVGTLEARGAHCRYLHFPYDMLDAQGFVRFSNDGIVLDGLSARHGSAAIRVDGRLDSSASWTGFELDIRGTNVPLDRDLYQAVPERYRALWRQTSPIGLCDVRTTIRRAPGSEASGSRAAEVIVDARLLGGSVTFQDRRLHQVDGAFRIAGGKVYLHDLNGYLDGAPVRMRGEIGSGVDDEVDLYIEGADVAIEHIGNVQDSRNEPLGAISFTGRGDVWGRIRSSDAGAAELTVRVHDGAITGFDGRQAWSGAHGWIQLYDGMQRIVSLQARRAESWIELAGTIPAVGQADETMQVDLRAGDAQIDELLARVIPGRWTSIRNALGLAGAGTLAVDFRRAAADPGVRQSAQIELRAERMKPEPVPLEMHDIAARMRLEPDGFELYEARARFGDEGAISLRGRGGWDAEGDWSEVSVTADRIDVTPDFIAALPAPLANLLTRMAVAGRISTKLDRMRLERRGAQAWDISGRISLESSSIRIGFPLEDFEGRVAGNCQVLGDGDVVIDAAFEVDRGRLAGRAIERWEGRLRCERGSTLIQLDDVRGRVADGEVLGRATIDPETGAYELTLTLHDLSFDQVVRNGNGEAGAAPPRPGRLDGHVFVRGVGSDAESRTGGGELRIRGASLLSSRVTASVVEASREAARPISDQVEVAQIRFAWDGPVLLLTRVDIRSRDLRLIGEGRWSTTEDTIALTLVGTRPEDAPEMFLLSDLLESAGRELFQYRIDGSAADPHVRIEPLHNLTEPLRRLLDGE